MANYNPYGEDYTNPTQRALARPLTAPSFRPMAGSAKTPEVSGIESVTPERSVGSPVNAPAVGATTAAIQAAPAENTNPLAQWGYTGDIPINSVEQEAIDFVNNLYGTQGPQNTLTAAQDYYNRVLSGEFGPEGQKYLAGVIDPMRSAATQNYNDMAKALATKFSDIGGFYGGRAGVAQGRLAAESANNLDSQIAQLLYSQFNQNQGNMGNAAAGLGNLANIQSGLSGDMLNYLLSTGNLITGREALNKSQYQQALQNAYNDWVRARQEQLMPFAWAQNLTGQQATTPVVTTQQSPWGALLGVLGQGVGALTGGLGTNLANKII